MAEHTVRRVFHGGSWFELTTDPNTGRTRIVHPDCALAISIPDRGPLVEHQHVISHDCDYPGWNADSPPEPQPQPHELSRTGLLSRLGLRYVAARHRGIAGISFRLTKSV